MPTKPATPAGDGHAAPTATVSATWRIESGRVGAVELGKRLPESLIAGDLAARYLARYIADGQPADTFVYDAPPALIILDSGPFRARVSRTGDSAKPPTEALRGEAAASARNGAKVQTVMIRGAGPATAAGIGVGSTLAALQAAYSDLQLMPTPETLGDDQCQARTKSLPGVQFVFSTCSKAKSGAPIIRIDVSHPDE